MSTHPIRSAVFLCVLALPATGFQLTAQNISSRRISPNEEIGTVRGLPGRTVHAPLAKEPPPPPEVDLEEFEEKQPGPVMIEDGLAIAPQQTVETGGANLNQPETPGTFVLLRDTALAPPGGFSSNVNEPSIGGQADGIFHTHNWYAETSTNNGASWSYVSPFTTFANSPAAFSAGFCCDQRVAQDSSRNLVFWLMQWIKNGSTASSSNGDRLAVAHGQAGLASNTWTTYDFTPALFGLTGKWFDFPHLQASANDLYFTTNIFSTATDSYYGALVVRIPLAQLDAGGAITFDYFLVAGSYGSIMPVNGAAAEGTRPGRTTMYFASVFTSTSLKVLTWPEANAAPTVSDVTGLATTIFTACACTGPDGFDPCTRANSRAQTGWITDTELGIMWTSAQNGAARPYPYTRVAILNPATLAVISQPDIFSTTSAWLYPAVSVNERGHLGGTIDNLGGNVFPTIRALIRDDFSADPVVSGWETYPVATSTAGTVGRYGDYNGTQPHEKYPRTWLAAGHIQSGGTGNANSVTHNFWFSRDRDNPANVAAPVPLDYYTVSPCRVVDTRTLGVGGPLLSNVPRVFAAAGACGVPADAAAISVNVAVVGPPASGYVTLYPGNGAAPTASTINFKTGITLSNNAIVPLATNAAGTLGALSQVGSGLGVDMVVDVTGYFK